MQLTATRKPLAHFGAARCGIDARDWLVRKITYEDDHLGRGTITVRSLERTDDWPDSTFDLAIPDGVPITEVSIKGDDPLTLREAQAAVRDHFGCRSARPPRPGSPMSPGARNGLFALVTALRQTRARTYSMGRAIVRK